TFTTTGAATPAPATPAPPAAPALPGTPAPAVLTPATPEPVQGTSVVVAPTRGTVLVKSPTGSGFIPLTEDGSVPVGSVVDTRAGAITLTSSVAGGTQTGTFRGGMFEVRQSRSGTGMTDIVLRGGDFSSCGRA